MTSPPKATDTSLPKSLSSQQNEFYILSLRLLSLRGRCIYSAIVFQKAQCGSTTFWENSWKEVVFVGGLQRAPASIWVTEGKSWVRSLALTLDNSAPGLLSPLPIYKSDRLKALRAPRSYKSGSCASSRAVAASPRVTPSAPAHQGEF